LAKTGHKGEKKTKWTRGAEASGFLIYGKVGLAGVVTTREGIAGEGEGVGLTGSRTACELHQSGVIWVRRQRHARTKEGGEGGEPGERIRSRTSNKKFLLQSQSATKKEETMESGKSDRKEKGGSNFR